MRLLFLNLLTLSATAVVLALLSLPALGVLGAEGPPAAATRVAAAARPLPVERQFGVAVDPWHLDDWSRSVGAQPTLLPKFEAFARRRPLGPYLAEAQRRGVKGLMVSWEPWRPVPA